MNSTTVSSAEDVRGSTSEVDVEVSMGLTQSSSGSSSWINTVYSALALAAFVYVINVVTSISSTVVDLSTDITAGSLVLLWLMSSGIHALGSLTAYHFSTSMQELRNRKAVLRLLGKAAVFGLVFSISMVLAVTFL